MTKYSDSDNPESGFNATAQLKPQADFQALTLAKWLMAQNVAARPGDNDIESILHELATDSKQLVGLDGVKSAVQDIIVGDIVDHNWQNVNSDGSEGGVGENHDTTNLAARGAAYYAPSFSDGNTDNFILIRIPNGSDVRHYRIVISGVEGAIGANLLLALGHSADNNWSYYGYGYAEINAFAGAQHTITLQISDRVLAHTTWAGKLGKAPLDEVASAIKTKLDEVTMVQSSVDTRQDDEITALERLTQDLTVNNKNETTYNGRLGDAAQADLAGKRNQLIWTDSANTSTWNNPGRILTADAADAIYQGLLNAPYWKRLEVEIAYSAGNPALYEYALGTIATVRGGGGGKPNNAVRLHGIAFLGALLDIQINLVSGGQIRADNSHMKISGVSWAQGTEQFDIKLYGIK